MGDFVTGLRPLPPPKVDAYPPQGQPGELDASDINDIWNALSDVRTGIGFPNRTVVSDTDYSVNPTDFLIAFQQLTAQRTVTLPSASAGLRQIIIKDESGSASETIPITVVAQPGETVDGTASPALLTVVIRNFGSAALYSNGVEWRTLYSDKGYVVATGAIPRSIDSLLLEAVGLSVTAFGAKGDGTTDDSPAFVLANAAAVGGRNLFIPKGTYRISQNTTCDATVQLLMDAGAQISVDTGKTFTANGRVIAFGGNPNTGLGTFTYGNSVNLIANDLGFAVGTIASRNSDDFIHLQRNINTSSGINLSNEDIGSAAEAYIHMWGGPASGGSQGSSLRMSANSLAGGKLVDIVAETNLGFAIIQQSDFPMDFYAGNYKQFQILNITNAVNQIQVKGGAAASSPNFTAIGNDTNISLVYNTKGSGSHFFRTGSTLAFQLEIKDTAGATNRVVVTGSNGGNPTVSASGGSLALTAPVVGTGVGANGSGLKHSRVTTGSIAANTDVDVTVTWSTAFADANYTVAPSVVDATAALASLKVVHVTSIAAATCVVRVRNDSAGALTGTLHVIAIHD